MQRFNQPSQMTYNIIFPTETNFPIRSRYVFYFMFPLTFKAYVIFVTFQSNLYVVLAHGKGHKNVHRDLFKTEKTLNKIFPDSQLRFACLTKRG